MTEWNKGDLDSFLIEITADILKFKDDKGDYLVEKIRDAAGQVTMTTVLLVKLVSLWSQKGTGKWTAISALDKGVPVTLIG